MRPWGLRVWLGALAAAGVLAGCGGEETAPTETGKPSVSVAAAAPAYLTVSAGASHACAVRTDGTVFCWKVKAGKVAAPVQVPGSQTLHFAGVRAGVHDCGLTTDRKAYCWGPNASGQLGNGTRIASKSPVLVGPNYISISPSPGGEHTCGTTGDGVVNCWGANSFGQLQIGAGTSPSLSPRPASSGLFLSASVGYFHSCAVSINSRIACWGNNTFNQLAAGNPASGVLFGLVTSGGFHTCGLSGTRAYCWGFNRDGEIGDGTTTQRNVPTAVAGGLSLSSVSAGLDHSCGLVGSGAAYCWGSNAYGQLGRGNFSRSTRPVQVIGGLTFTSISAGGFTTCGLTKTAAVYCWGGGVRSPALLPQ